MKQKIPTPASIRKAYVEEYLKRRPDAEEFARFTESELADFIRKHESPNFESIYTQLDHNYYDRVRHDMAIDGLMRTEDNAADNRYSLHLKTWSGFLESKAFRNLFKTKIAIEDMSSDAEPSAPSAPSFREETEGERKHILKEMDVIRRNLSSGRCALTSMATNANAVEWILRKHTAKNWVPTSWKCIILG